ncbi:hypothetical protein SNEBB_007891 [Seison nebaliae]|nr:hypothetical protein SNEBB_007891 [Seison nebaliae]
MLTDNNSQEQHISHLAKKLGRVIETEDEKEKEKNSFKSQLTLLQTRVEQQKNLINELHQKYQTQIRDLQIKSENIGDNPKFGYLRRVLFEYIMGHEQNTMIKVIVAILQFPTEEGTQLIKRTEENHFRSLTPWFPYIGKK